MKEYVVVCGCGHACPNQLDTRPEERTLAGRMAATRELDPSVLAGAGASQPLLIRMAADWLKVRSYRDFCRISTPPLKALTFQTRSEKYRVSR